jgi:hypothetical protein
MVLNLSHSVINFYEMEKNEEKKIEISRQT